MSAEHEVSLASTKNVIAALDRDKYEVNLVLLDRDGTLMASGGGRAANFRGLVRISTERAGENGIHRPVFLVAARRSAFIGLHPRQSAAPSALIRTSPR
jgi:D-alanine-D-alanine ligase-like ATP-grasp enzyme